MSDTTMISSAGEAVYPHLNKPDVRFNEAGEYKVTLKVSKSNASKMIEAFDNAIEKSISEAKEKNKGKQIKSAPKPYTDEGENVLFKFKMKATGQNRKTKEAYSQRPALFDAKKNPISPSTSIWGGSEMKVAYQLVPYYTPMLGAGVSARLKAVQVLKLVQGKSGADLFATEDGFEVAETTNEVNSEETSEVQENSDF